MTPETKIKLIDSIEKRLNVLTQELESLKNTYRKLRVSEKFSVERKLDVDFKGIKGIINYRLFIGILTSDLCCAILSYLNAKFQYQGLFSARQIIVIISEGYKKIYNFTFENEHGDLVSKHRNNSFWIKEIGPLVKELPVLQSQYNSTTEKLDNYLSVNFDLLKEQRDLSIHYDKEPIKFIQMVSSLDIEDTFKKLIPFLQILNEMFSFTSALSEESLKKMNTKKKEFNEKLKMLETLIINSKTTETQNVVDSLLEKISELNSNLNK